MFKNKIKDNVFEKIVLLLFIIIYIFLISVSVAVGQVVINRDTIVVPSSVSENSNITLSFSASTDIAIDINYSIYYDGLLLSNSNTTSIFMNYSSSGIHNITFFASDNESNDSVVKYFTVADVSLTLTLTSPINETYNTPNISINVSTSNPVDKCIYTLNNSVNNMLMSDSQDFYQEIILKQEGEYMLSVNCSNNYDSAIATSIFTVDSQAPVIISESYAISADNIVTINAATDVACICKYDTVDKPYDSMGTIFSNTNSVQHSTEISGLNDGSYTYYIKCKNANNDITNTEILSFDIVTKPTARISLSKSPPIKAGTYAVSLVTSKPVNSAPSLYYNFDDDATPKYITLTGSGTDWNGYLIIADDTPNKIGTFHYSATDMYNNIGALITDGEIFLVDTLKPIAPSSVAAIAESNGNIQLKWYYDGEDVQRYNIYRSTSGDPDYVDYYDSSNSNQYIDSNVINGIIYYYRVAAVDNAENDGILSTMVQATSNRVASDSNIVGVQDTPVIAQALDTALVPKVTQLVTELNLYLTDIDAVKSELDKTNDPNTLKIINVLQLSEKTKTAQDTIKGLIDNANSLKSQNLANSDLDVQLNKLRMDAIKAESLVAEDIIVNDQSEYNQVTQGSDVDEAITEAVTVNLSRTVLNNYSLTNKQIQDNIAVKTDILIFEIKYLGKDDYDKYTLVKKVVTSSQSLENVSIIEIIPKSFETKASDIVFDLNNQEKPGIIQEDPVLRWDVDAFNTKTIYYMINSNAEMSSAKATKTVVLYRPDFKVTDTISENNTKNSNLLTGFIGLETVNISNLSLIQWLVIIGVGMILGLSAYYVALDKKEKKRDSQRLKDHRIITKQVQSIPVSTRNNIATPNIKISNLSLTSTKPGSAPVKLVSMSTLSSSDINKKLDQANFFINNFDYENSRILYNECMKNYPKVIFKNTLEKNNTKLMLDHLFQKITVYRIIYSSRKHITTKNFSLLKQDIAAMNRICNVLYSTLGKIDDDNINAEKKFVDYVINSKRHLEAISL